MGGWRLVSANVRERKWGDGGSRQPGLSERRYNRPDVDKPLRVVGSVRRRGVAVNTGGLHQIRIECKRKRVRVA